MGACVPIASASKKGGHKEDDAVEPWTVQAKYKREAEIALLELRERASLPLVIVRPALVYGPSDTSALMPRIATAAVYKETKATMMLLWDASMKLNTVHVADVCRAIWFLSWGKAIEAGARPQGDRLPIYNLTDKSDSDQGSVNKYVSIFVRQDAAATFSSPVR